MKLFVDKRAGRWLLGTLSLLLVASLSVGAAELKKAEDKGKDPKAAADDDKPELEIVSPRPDDKVDVAENVSITTNAAGTPVVLVRADVKGSFWWAQKPANALNRFRYLSATRFGNGKTPVGTKFKIIALLITDEKDLELCPPGAPLEEIPKDLPVSNEVSVVFHPAPGKISKRDVILEPKNKGTVTRLTPLSGRVTTKGWPIVVVRSTEPGSLWWVQAPVSMTDDNHFRLMARFGNTETKDGAEFEVTFLITPKPDGFKAGDSMPKLPADITRSHSIKVNYVRPPKPTR